MSGKVKVFSYYFNLEDFTTMTVRDAEKKAIEHALARAVGNKNKAASILKISREKLTVKMSDYGIGR